jgi:hypothetical protein
MHHGEFAASLTQQGGLHRASLGMDAAALQLPLRNRVEVGLAEVILWPNAGEIGVMNALHHQLIAIFPGIEVVKHKTLGGRHDPRRLARIGA